MEIINKNGKHYLECNDYELCLVGSILCERLENSDLANDYDDVKSIVDVIVNSPVSMEYQSKFQEVIF